VFVQIVFGSSCRILRAISLQICGSCVSKEIVSKFELLVYEANPFNTPDSFDMEPLPHTSRSFFMIGSVHFTKVTLFCLKFLLLVIMHL
jgi:hypothetical protein